MVGRLQGFGAWPRGLFFHGHTLLVDDSLRSRPMLRSLALLTTLLLINAVGNLRDLFGL